MFTITELQFGILLCFKGFVDVDEMKEWYTRSYQLLEKKKSFGVIVDLRNILPISVTTREWFKRGQKFYHENGMHRSAVIIKNSVAQMQFQQVAKESGIYQWERYIDADANPDWVKSALLWVQNGINPGKLS